MKLRVIRDTDTSYVGMIEATPGMPIKGGRKIEKVNNKSILVRSIEVDDYLEKLEDASIWYTDAIKFCFDAIESDLLEHEAAKRREFSEGESWYEQKGEFVNSKILENTRVKAGYEFARATAILRELALKGL